MSSTRSLALACTLGCWLSLAAAAASGARAQVPLRIPVHASLLDDAGRPVNREVRIVFAIYASARGGEALYSETRTAQVKDGQLDFMLGELTPLDRELFVTHGALYLGVKVEQDDEATPRLELGSVPFALSAEHAHDATTVAGLGAEELQKRVVGSCASGEAMVEIEASGQVRCEPLAAAMRGPKGVDGAPGAAGPQGEKGERGEPGPSLSFDCAGLAVSAVDELGRPTCIPLANVNARAGAGLAVNDCAGGVCEFSVAPESLGMGAVNLPMSEGYRMYSQLLSEPTFFSDGVDFIADEDGQCLVLASLEIPEDTRPRGTSSGRIGMRIGYTENGAFATRGLLAFANLPTDGLPAASTVQHAVIQVRAGRTYRFGCLVDGKGPWVGTSLHCYVSRLCQ